MSEYKPYVPVVRDPYKELVSVKVGATLDKYFKDLAKQVGLPVQIIHRDALERFTLEEGNQLYLRQQEQIRRQDDRIMELEAEIKRLQSVSTPNIILPIPPSVPDNSFRNELTAALVPTQSIGSPVPKILEASVPEKIDTKAEIIADFERPEVVEAMRQIATLVQEGNIEFSKEAIVEHYKSVCPVIRTKTHLRAIETVATLIENRELRFDEPRKILDTFLSFHPESNEVSSHWRK